MIKKNFLFLCLIVLWHGILMAQSISVDGIEYRLLSSDHVIITGVDGSFRCQDGVLKLPAIIKHEGLKYRVKGIGELAFFQNDDIRRLVIPAGVDTIASGAFWQCHNLESVKMPNRRYPVFVDYLAFDDTKWFNDQPDGMTYLGKIAYKYKGECPETVVIAKGTEAISKSAFYTPAIHYRDYHQIERISDRLQEVVIPKGVKYVSGFKCSALKKARLPKSVVEIGDNAFTACNLANIILPDKLKRLGESCFEGCSQITEMVLPAGLESIGRRAFCGCTGIKELIIPNKIEVLPQGMIECLSNEMLGVSKESALKSLTLGAGVKKIGKWALQGHNLESIRSYAEIPPVIVHNEQNDRGDWLKAVNPGIKECTLYVPSGSVDLYRSADGWSTIVNVFELISYPDNNR